MVKCRYWRNSDWQILLHFYLHVHGCSIITSFPIRGDLFYLYLSMLWGGDELEKLSKPPYQRQLGSSAKGINHESLLDEDPHVTRSDLSPSSFLCWMHKTRSEQPKKTQRQSHTAIRKTTHQHNKNLNFWFTAYSCRWRWWTVAGSANLAAWAASSRAESEEEEEKEEEEH